MTSPTQEEVLDPAAGRILGAGSNSLQRSIDANTRVQELLVAEIRKDAGRGRTGRQWLAETNPAALSKPGSPAPLQRRTTSVAPMSPTPVVPLSGGQLPSRARTTSVGVTQQPQPSPPIPAAAPATAPAGGGSGAGGGGAVLTKTPVPPRGPNGGGGGGLPAPPAAPPGGVGGGAAGSGGDQPPFLWRNAARNAARTARAAGRWGSAVVKMGSVMDTYSQWAGIANAAPYSADGTNGGSVNAIRKAVFGSEGQNLTGWAQDVQDAQAAAFLVSRNAGFTELTPGSRNINPAFTGYLGNVKDLSLLNPTMKAADVAGMMGSMTSVRGLYAAQMYGYKPLLGPQGRIERGALGGFADSLMQRTFRGKSAIDPAELKASLGQNGSLHANVLAYVNSVGGDASMTTALEDYITGRNTAAARGLSGAEFDTLMSDYEAGGSKGEDAGKRLKKFGVTNTILQSQKDADAAKSGNISDLMDSLGPAVKRANEALKDFYNFLDDIVNIPGVKQTLGTAAGWGSVFGPALGSAFGAMAGMRMGGGMLSMGGSLLGMRPVTAGGGGGLGAAAGAGRLLRGAGYGAAAVGVNEVGGGLVDQISDPKLRAAGSVLVDAGTGALVGAGVGSVVPGIGTGIGAAVGGVIGAGAGLVRSLSSGGSERERTTRSDGVNGGAEGSKGKGGGGEVPSGEAIAGKRASGAIRAALSEVGKPYEWGATGPNSFDCSGLMQFAYKKIGVRLPRVSQQQMRVGQPVKRKEARPGDLMFPNPGHVVMYLGGNKIVEAPRPGKNVRVVSADSYGSYQSIRRIVGAVGSFDGAEDQDANTQKEQTNNLGGDSGSMVFSGDYGSTEEVDAISSVMAGAGSALLNSPMGHSASKPETDEGSEASVERAPGSVKGNVALGKKMAAAKGWVGRQWDALYQLWMGESGWNEHADNPSSDAYGIPQAMTNLHKETNTSSWKNSPKKQISWGLDYIDRAYGDPVNAYGKWKSRKPHWYNTGAWEIPEDQPAVVHKGEMVIEKPKADAIRSVLMRDIVPVRDAATGTSSRSASDGAVSLVFNNGSIVVQVNGAATDSSAREAAKSFVDQLKQDKRLRTLARGQ